MLTLPREKRNETIEAIIKNATRMSRRDNRTEPVIECVEYKRRGEHPEICDDGIRPSVTLAAISRRKKIVGGISMVDMRIERDRPGLFRVKAKPGPGLPRTDDLNQYRVWGRTLGWMLRNNLHMRGGEQELDIVEWILPRRPRFRWTSRGKPGMNALFAELSTGIDRVNSDEDDMSPISFRRSGA